MANYIGQTFVARHPPPGRAHVGHRFERCFFDNCSVYPADTIHRRTTFREIQLVDCRVWACHVFHAVIDGVVVDGLKTGGGGGRTIGFSVIGCALRHVVLRGQIGSIDISLATEPWHPTKPSLMKRLFPKGDPGRRAPESDIDGANARFYEDLDWALDISEGSFYSLQLRGVPASLIRRDQATQAIVTRAKARDRAWESLDLGDTYWPLVLASFVDYDTADDIVLVAPRRTPRFKALVEGIKKLRDAGVAEQD